MQQHGSSSIISATGTCRTFLEIFHNKSLVKKWSSFCPPRCWRALNLNLKIKVCINSVIMKVSFRPGYSSFTPPYDQLHLSGHSQHCSEKVLNHDSFFYERLICGGFIFVKLSSSQCMRQVSNSNWTELAPSLISASSSTLNLSVKQQL